jgi:hypothetical protein
MTKDEALDLALEALEGVVKNCWRDIPSWRLDEIIERITAIKQALAAPVQEPVATVKAKREGGTFVHWTTLPVAGMKLYTAPPAAQPAPVQEPLGFTNAGNILEMQQGRLPYGYVYPKGGSGASVPLYTTPPAQPAPVQPVSLPLRETEDMHDAVMSVIYRGVSRTNTDALWQAYRKVLTTAPPAAQPAPVAAIPMHRIADVESTEIDDMRPGRAYREGWNECRAAMLASAQPAPVAQREAIKELADQYARECVEFSKAIHEGAHSMSPIAVKSGDTRLELHTAIDAITIQPAVQLTISTPPAAQRQWVGLTDVNAVELWQLARHDIVDFARVIEAKLKEKNHDPM